ncbi:uncharacterized protein G2W53_027305 [Senna tora]|uniref:Uncharacterized protein n=1 Tax=Senna tora TaxID=362788 RepID=A0A834THE2_9FABA|nr:uncharacterized protein G2W53_027305 [Senna tora]
MRSVYYRAKTNGSEGTKMVVELKQQLMDEEKHENG